MYWIDPLNRPVPIVVEAETIEEAKEKISKCPDYDGERIIAVQVDFYATLSRSGAAGPALAAMNRSSGGYGGI